MAKKQTFTVGSKDNMRSRLQELKDYTFNPLTGVNPSEEQYEFDMAQTKPLNTSSLEETPKQEKNVTTEDASATKSGKGPNYIADPVFSFINGIQQDMVDRPTGDMLLNNKEKDELEFQKVFLETEKEMKLLDQQLNRAYLDKDTDKVHELYPQYKATFDAYSSMLDEYKKVASNTIISMDINLLQKKDYKLLMKVFLKENRSLKNQVKIFKEAEIYYILLIVYTL